VLWLTEFAGFAGFSNRSSHSRPRGAHVHGIVHGTSGSHGSGGSWWVGLLVLVAVVVAFGFALRYLLRRVASRR
jgi:hypothetical protein